MNSTPFILRIFVSKILVSIVVALSDEIAFDIVFLQLFIPKDENSCIIKDVMDYFTITDYSYESTKKTDTFKATVLVINDRRIYADDFDDDENIDIRIDRGVLTIFFEKGTIRSTNWTFIDDSEMSEDDKMYYKDFTRL